MAGPRYAFARFAAIMALRFIARASGLSVARSRLRRIDVSVMTALRMARLGIIKGRQVCRGAPWAFKATDIAAYRAQTAAHRPLTADPTQQRFDFQ
jgi:hypothetical protein